MYIYLHNIAEKLPRIKICKQINKSKLHIHLIKFNFNYLQNECPSYFVKSRIGYWFVTVGV
jgi:hypothetical protein